MAEKPLFFKPLIAHQQIPYPISWNTLFGRPAPLEVEIGFGMGEVLLKKAQELPGSNFIGFEQNGERAFKTLLQIALTRPAVNNIRLLKVDARTGFERFFKEKTIDHVYSLFPCPWPKKAHMRHRLFSYSFLKLLNSRLKKKGSFKIVTDYEDYARWVIEQAKGTGFGVETKTSHPQYNTKFERKWLLQGQKEFFELNFVKEKHMSVPVTKEIKLKSYTLKHFDPDRFVMPKETGKISVISKEFLYDSRKHKAMVYLVVVEDHLVQHFWVGIVKKARGWHVGRSDGQNIFQTPGLNRALKLVYDAAAQTSFF